MELAGRQCARADRTLVTLKHDRVEVVALNQTIERAAAYVGKRYVWSERMAREVRSRCAAGFLRGRVVVIEDALQLAAHDPADHARAGIATIDELHFVEGARAG